jgi:hypothetical protein
MSATLPSRRGAALAAAAVFAAFTAVGLLTLRDYGITWDEMENFIVGERLARFWVEGNPARLVFADDANPDWRRVALHSGAWVEATRDAMRPAQHRRFAAFETAQPWRYPPLANTLSGLSCLLFFHRLGWLAPVDAHHFAIVLFGAFAVALVFHWTARRYGWLAGGAAALLLAAHPRFFAHAHNNIKDLPETALFTAAVLAAANALERAAPARIAAAAVVWGAALAIRPNALFAPLVVLPWALAGGNRARLGDRRVLAALAASPAIAAATVAALWPYLWFGHSWAKLRSAIGYWQWIGTSERAEVTFTWAYYVLIATPPLLLAGAALGLLALAQRRDRNVLLLATWFALPIVRVSLPYTHTYNGLRHFLEHVPALAILAGIGIAAVARDLALQFPRQRAAVGVALLLLAAATLREPWRYHPHEITYFNGLAGGLRGAVAAHVRDAADYWGSSYRSIATWLNAHAERDATVLVYRAAHLLRYDNPRPDLAIAESDTLPPGFRGYFVYLAEPQWRRPPDPIWKCERRFEIVHRVDSDGVPIATVCRVDDSANAPRQWLPPLQCNPE